ncbi:MAG: DUF2235 domain-containing protein [Brachymonas sp.]|nr:DUF2235 domain-containing protein [Brachymonas sp.]
MGKDVDEVGYDLATQADLDRYAEVQQQLTQMQAPLLLDTSNPHQRLYIAAMDGTENSVYQDPPKEWSAVGKIYKQLDDIRPVGVVSGYVEGIGTQRNKLAAKWDSINGYSFDERLETAYYKFCVQAGAWLKEDPQAQIRVAGLGFSRGAELSAALSRVIHERGIMDPDDAKFQEKDGLITQIEYTRGHLVQPGQTPQALMLFDPVATSVLEHDRRVAPSVLGALVLTARDEARDLFKGNRLIADGLTENGYFLNATVPGAHSDLGNTYPRNGLGVLSANLAVDYLNSLSNQDFLHKQTPPQQPEQYAIHRSYEHLPIYNTNGFHDGERDFIHQPGPKWQCKVEPQSDCTSKAPVGTALNAQIARQPVRIQEVDAPPQIQSQDKTPTQASNDIEALFLRMSDAAMRGDHEAVLQVGRAYRESSAGQAWLQQGREYNQAQQEALEQQMAQQQAQQQTEAQRGPVMTMQ